MSEFRCRKCFLPIDEGEPFLEFASIVKSRPDGSVLWSRFQVHRDWVYCKQLETGEAA